MQAKSEEKAKEDDSCILQLLQKMAMGWRSFASLLLWILVACDAQRGVRPPGKPADSY